MHIHYNMQLKPFNTLNLDATASHYVKIENIQDVQDALAFAQKEQLNVIDIFLFDASIVLIEIILLLALNPVHKHALNNSTKYPYLSPFNGGAL